MQSFDYRKSSAFKGSNIFHNGLADPDHKAEVDDSVLDLDNYKVKKKEKLQDAADELMNYFKN